MPGGFTHDDVPAQTGRTFLVTGANTGIGLEAARVLAARGARVLLGCRSRERAETAMRAIEAETSGADLAFVELDQADLASVARITAGAGVHGRSRCKGFSYFSGMPVPE